MNEHSFSNSTPAPKEPRADDRRADDGRADRRRAGRRRADRGRADRRRAEILDAARDVIAEYGFAAATVRRVAQRAGVSDGTIYNYFDDKPALLEALLERLGEAECRKVPLGSRPAAGFRDRFGAYVRHRTTVLWGNLDLLRAVLPELLVRSDLATRYRAAVLDPAARADEAVLERLGRQNRGPRSDPVLTVRVIAATFIGLAVLRLLGDPPLDRDPDAIADVITEVLLDGVGADRDGSC